MNQDLSDTLAELVGMENISPQSKWGKLIRSSGVPRSSDFRRIEALPRRRWQDDPDLPRLTELLTDHLKKPYGTMALRPVQAAALRDLHDQRGLFGPVAVGRGKALITLLAPVVLKAERPVLMVPASLRDQTLRKVIPQMRRHWRLHPMLRVVGYSEISLEKNAKMLESYAPDLIICDECDYLARKGSGRTRRVGRYMHDHPETVFVAVSGSVCRKSIEDYWHLLLWSLKPDKAPLPGSWRELQEWALALDVDVPDDKRSAAGALELFCNNGETPRQGYRRRLVETPGVIATEEEALGVSLRLHKRDVDVDPVVWHALRKLRETWETPNGDCITEAIDLWRHARELACGFFYRWQPMPPKPWIEARRAWKKYARETLKTNRRGLDTELQVWNECVYRGLDPWHEGRDVWLAWRDLKDTFKINTVPEWISDFLVEDIAKWLQESGIAWVEHTAVGERLSQLTGLPYFAGGEKASRDILDASGPIIASIEAHGRGKNLQETWSRNLVVSVPPSGRTVEQLIGRTHRMGQRADEVGCWLYLHTEELVGGMEKAFADARFLEDTLGSAQKLNFADVTWN